MKILLCSHNPLDRRLGAPKALMELAAELEETGWQCTLASPTDICPDIQKYRGMRQTLAFSRALATYIETKGHEFDVVDFEGLFLPFRRDRFPARTLLVARTVLLIHHFDKIRIPSMPGFRSRIGALWRWPTALTRRKIQNRLSERTYKTADMVNVNNDYDRVELIERGIDPAKIVVTPLGIAAGRIASFGDVAPVDPKFPRVAFLGTFDERKGASDLPEIVRHVTDAVPGCRFHLVGTRNRSAQQVLHYFPARLRSHIEVTPAFEPDALPSLLRDCAVGIFPSYIEGFGFAVLEMLSAALPVVAYDAPGAPTMLPGRYLVRRGDARGLAEKVIALLRDPEELAAAQIWARKRAYDFTWKRAGELTGNAYADRVALLRAAPPEAR
jgi:glycosyltransferase involved in cell wall biosynthesis